MKSKSIPKKALISVSNKNSLAEFASELSARGINIIASGGTAKSLTLSSVPVLEVSKYTGFPEIMGGRVKTLHPKIHAGILARLDIDDEVLEAEEIELIDFVVVNLYPFSETINQPQSTFQQALEQIDIGGPCLIRAAAKNHERVTVITDPSDYNLVLQEIDLYGNTTLETRRKLAAKAFSHTAKYDGIIANYFQKLLEPSANCLPATLNIHFKKVDNLRYGENPHQSAGIYTSTSFENPNDSTPFSLLQGKELSYNNIIDSETALQCLSSLDQSQAGCVIIKHATPCGAAQASSQVDAYNYAYRTDPSSAFGGILAFNQIVTEELIKIIFDNQFVEVIIAPSFTTGALENTKTRPNVRLLKFQDFSFKSKFSFSLISLHSSMLIQTKDTLEVNPNNFKIMTQKKPSDTQLIDLLFAWRVSKFVKSNAIVYAMNQATLGIGSGQTSRIFSAKIGILKAEEANLSLQNAVMASDAFFPFADSVKLAAQVGISAIIQTGGSIRDKEVIKAADDAGISMIFTGIRHFRH